MSLSNIRQAKYRFGRITRWLYSVECSQYSIQLETLGYLCTSCLLLFAFDDIDAYIVSPLSRDSVVDGNRRLSVVSIICCTKLIYDFLLMINTNLPPILHRFGDTAFQMTKSHFATPLAFKPPDGGVPLGAISVKFSVDVNEWPRQQNAKKNCRKI